MAYPEIMKAAGDAHEAWVKDNKGCEFFSDYLAEQGYSNEVHDKAMEMLFAGSFNKY